jgi:hypothetical protein
MRFGRAVHKREQSLKKKRRDKPGEVFRVGFFRPDVIPGHLPKASEPGIQGQLSAVFVALDSGLANFVRAPE